MYVSCAPRHLHVGTTLEIIGLSGEKALGGMGPDAKEMGFVAKEVLLKDIQFRWDHFACAVEEGIIRTHARAWTCVCVCVCVHAHALSARVYVDN